MKDIFHLLEADFNPLELCSKLAPLLEKLPGLNTHLSSAAPVQTADLALYRPALQRVAITKMLQQLSQVRYFFLNKESDSTLISFCCVLMALCTATAHVGVTSCGADIATASAS